MAGRITDSAGGVTNRLRRARSTIRFPGPLATQLWVQAVFFLPRGLSVPEKSTPMIRRLPEISRSAPERTPTPASGDLA